MIKKTIIFAACVCLIMTGCTKAEDKENPVATASTAEEISVSETTAEETTTEEIVEEVVEEVVDEAADETVDKIDDTVITDADVINLLSSMNDCSTKYILNIDLSVDTNAVQQFDTRGVEEPFYKVTEQDITTISKLKEKMSEYFTESYLQDIFSGEYVGSVGLNYFYSDGTDGLYVCGDNFDAMNSNMSIRNYVEFDSFIQQDNEIEVILREDYDFDFDTNDFVKRDEVNYYSIVFKNEGSAWKADSFVGTNCGYDEPNNYIMLYNAFKDGKITAATDSAEVEDEEIVDYCVLTKESVETAHPEIEGRTEEEVRDLLTVLTDDELKTLCPTDEDLDVFIQIARGREGNMFRDVTLDSIAKAASDSSIYYNADCDIVFDFEGYEGVPVTVYYSKPKFLVYDWSLLVADAFRYDAEKIKEFCQSDDYEVIKTADVSEAKEILIAHGGEPADWV